MRRTSRKMSGDKRRARPALCLHIKSPARYSDCATLQEQLVGRRLAGRITDIVLFVEHSPVVTLGRRGETSSLLLTAEELKSRGVELEVSTRGGDATYHGPGQIVMYPVILLRRHERDVKRYVASLEEVAIRTAADFGVTAFRRPGMTGAWTDRGKLAAIGVRIRRWVTSHGMSFNVDGSLAGFTTIVPCGLRGEAVTSLRKLLGARCPPAAAVRRSLASHFAGVFGRGLASKAAADLRAAGAYLRLEPKRRRT